MVPSGGTVPANLPAFLWRPESGFDTPVEPNADDIVLREEGGATIAVTLAPVGGDLYAIEPTEELVPGASYSLQVPGGCEPAEPDTYDYVAGDAAALPGSLGTLALTEQAAGSLEVATASGSCSTSIEATHATIELPLAPEARPWEDVFLYETWVDGERWFASASLPYGPELGASWVGRGTDRLYALCASDDPSVSPGLAEGVHTVEMRATLPGTEVALASTALMLELRCEGAPTVDAGMAAPDAGPSGGGDAGPTSEDDPPPMSDSGCSVGGASANAWPMVAPLALALLALRRRRRV